MSLEVKPVGESQQAPSRPPRSLASATVLQAPGVLSPTGPGAAV